MVMRGGPEFIPSKFIEFTDRVENSLPERIAEGRRIGH